MAARSTRAVDLWLHSYQLRRQNLHHRRPQQDLQHQLLRHWGAQPFARRYRLYCKLRTTQLQQVMP